MGKSWIYRYRDAEGRERFCGLGPWPAVSLEEARTRAVEMKRMRLDGRDPIAERLAQEAKAEFAATSITFRAALDKVIDLKRPEWKAGSGSEAQWRQTMNDYVLPKIGSLDLRQIEPAHVLAVLEPIWSTKLETASRTRNRIEQVLGWGIGMGLADAPNAARLKGNLDVLLPRHSVIQKKDAAKAVKHHAALPYAQAPAFVAELRQREGLAARALEFTMLTSVRTANTRGATWDQFDLEVGIWTLPAEVMKASREHVVPLARQTIALLKGLKGNHETLVFPNPAGDAMSENAMLALIGRMKRKGEVTSHGMRSTFADWCTEQTNFDRDAVRIQLAHNVGDATQRAYMRGALLEKRRVIVQAWADYLEGLPASGIVTPMRHKGKAA